MATKQQPTAAAEYNDAEGRLHAVIAKHVLDVLGRPDDSHGVKVRRLWDDHYRVNILIGVGAASVRVAHSYFLVADGEGKILQSTPPIMKQY